MIKYRTNYNNTYIMSDYILILILKLNLKVNRLLNLVMYKNLNCTYEKFLFFLKAKLNTFLAVHLKEGSEVLRTDVW